jgi:hypothetical protein
LNEYTVSKLKENSPQSLKSAEKTKSLQEINVASWHFCHKFSIQQWSIGITITVIFGTMFNFLRQPGHLSDSGSDLLRSLTSQEKPSVLPTYSKLHQMIHESLEGDIVGENCLSRLSTNAAICSRGVSCRGVEF